MPRKVQTGPQQPWFSMPKNDKKWLIRMSYMRN